MPNMNLNRSVYIGGDKIVKCIWQVERIHVLNSQIYNHRFNSLDFTLKDSIVQRCENRVRVRDRD